MRGQLRHSPAKSFPVLLHPATRELCARPLFLSVLHLLLEALEPQLADFSVSVRTGARIPSRAGYCAVRATISVRPVTQRGLSRCALFVATLAGPGIAWHRMAWRTTC
jgi:hypothetical protein